MMDFNIHGKHLISLVQQQTILWDKKNVNFKNSHMKSLAWDQIGQVFGLTGEQASLSFTSLRQKYIREKEKETAAARNGAPGGKPKKQWFLIDRMRFLDDVITPRKTHTSVISDDYTESNSSSIITITKHENLDTDSEIEETCTSTFSSSTTDKLFEFRSCNTTPLQTHDPLQPPTSPPVKTVSPQSSPKPSTSKKKRKNDESEISALISAMQAPIRVETDDSWKVKDEVKAFCRYFGTKIDRLPDDVRSDFENECLSRLHDLEKTLKY